MNYQKKRVNSVDSEAIVLLVQCIRLRDFEKKSLAIAQNGSVAAFFFFPLIQFTDSVKNSTFGLNINYCKTLIKNRKGRKIK